MRRLKVLTTSLLVSGFGLLVAWPWAVGARPTTRDGLRDYVFRAGIYFSALLIIFFATTVCAWLIVRKQREEYRRESLENLHELIKSTLEDHERKDS